MAARAGFAAAAEAGDGARYLGRPDPPAAKPVTLGGLTVQVKAADPDAPVPSVAVTIT
jgi:hypothetical protein